MMKRNNSVFSKVGGLRPGLSQFDLSYEKVFDADMGILYPVMCDEVVPGDFFKIGNQAVIRFQPLVAPIMHEINMYVHYFFVPYRLLWDQWEDFISGGVTGNLTPSLPLWQPESDEWQNSGTMWDLMGMPMADPGTFVPSAFPKRAYNLVWNEYYRDQTLQSEVDLDDYGLIARNWEKDYFTSALPFQQRGTAPALPISGTAQADFSDGFVSLNWPATGAGSTSFNLQGTWDEEDVESGHFADVLTRATLGQSSVNTGELTSSNSVDLSTATTFDISDLRLAFQIQKWMERNARAGARYTEFLQSHFGVSPRDDRLQRPEYIGGSKAPIIISEVLQTSSTDATTPQGNLAGHGITVSQAYCGKYKATEYGLIIGMMSVMPRSVYSQGIDRQWLRRTKYDFYFPEFANLSEQAIQKGELFVKSADAAFNQSIFGYQGRYDEMRTKKSMVCGNLRPGQSLDYWNMARSFSQASPPALNDTFVRCIPRKDVFAVPSEPGLVVSFGNLIHAFRPMPISAEPGLIDHN